MTGLPDFLLARIAYDEHGARMLRDRGGVPSLVELTLGHRIVDRVLAECEAKRRIVDSYAGLRAEASRLHYAGEDQELIYTARNMYAGLEIALQFLALPYADHPDYRDEWRP